MKLLQKTNRIYFVLTSLILCLSGVLLYVLIVNFVEEESYEKQIVNKKRIVEKIRKNKSLINLSPTIETEKLFTEELPQNQISDTLIFDITEGETEPFIQYTFYEIIDNEKYKIVLRQNKLESHDFILNITISLLIVLVLLFLSLFFVNRFVLKKVWDSFYKNLKVLKNYSITEAREIIFFETNIKEFSDLNTEIENLIKKIISDFNLLKEFTENASHEIQTPISVIQLKLEQLLQSENLTENQSKILDNSLREIHKLSKLNESLILLTKIENNQFPDRKEIDLKLNIQKILEKFSFFIEEKNIKIDISNLQETLVFADNRLLEILIRNLISNSIKHNFKDGIIQISSNSKELVISNSGNRPKISTKRLFERFVKSESGSNSFGLGLAIVRQICVLNSWEIKYLFKDELHVLKIRFSE